MALGSQGQIGYAAESSYGTVTTPTVFVPYTGEGMKNDQEYLVSESISNHELLTVTDVAQGGAGASGSVGHELYTHGLEDLLTHIFGSVNKTGSGPYTRTYTLAPLQGSSLTLQTGKPSLAQVEPKTYPGTKVQKAQIKAEVGKISSIGLDFLSKWEVGWRTVTDGATTNTDATVTSASAAFHATDVGKPISGSGIPAGATIASWNSATSVEISANATATATGVTLTIGKALATASYSTDARGFTFAQATATLDGSAIKLNSFMLDIDNALEPRPKLGQIYSDEPLPTGRRKVTGTFTMEYESDTIYRKFVRGDAVDIVLAHVHPNGATFTITTHAYLTGTTPEVQNRGVVPLEVPFEVYTASTDAAGLSAVLVNSTP